MFRYRCPHCTKLLQAPEIRAGKTTVCSKCSQPLTIPAGKEHWLNERGEPLLTSPTLVIKTPPPVAVGPPSILVDPDDESDNDVLGAIFVGAIHPSNSSPAAGADPDSDTAPQPASEVAASPPPTAAELEPQPAPVPVVPKPAPGPIPAPTPVPAAVETELPLPTPAPAPVPAPAPPEPAVPTPAAARADEPSAPKFTPPPFRSKVPTPLPRTLPRRTLPGTAEPEPHTPAPAAVATEPPPAPRPPVFPTRASTSPGWGSPGSRGESRSRRTVATLPAPPRRTDDGGTVDFGDPLRLRNQMDIAADLTSALTSRMKPPPAPPRDLRPSTAIWLVTTGVAVALLVLTLVTQNSFAEAAAYLAAAQVAAGYVWIVALAFLRDWRRGVQAAVPPLTFWYLLQWKYAKYRPLRYTATGAVLLVLTGLVSYAQPRARAWAGVADPTVAPPAPPEITAQPKLVQLRHFRDQHQYDALIQLLRGLARTDPSYSEEAKVRVELAAELKALCAHKDSDVKVEAMAAYAAWGGDDARGLCLTATRSTNQDERMMALKLLSRWKDPEVARAIASRIGRPGTETTGAQDALIEIGGPVAERAAIPLLQDTYDQGVRLIAIDVLGNEKVGGPEAVAALRAVAQSSGDPGTRQPAAAKADQIAARLKK